MSVDSVDEKYFEVIVVAMVYTTLDGTWRIMYDT